MKVHRSAQLNLERVKRDLERSRRVESSRKSRGAECAKIEMGKR